MSSDQPILVGVDGSHASYKAVWWAANYAKHAKRSLQIVCVYSLPCYAAVSFDAAYTSLGNDNAAYGDAQQILGYAKAIADQQGVESVTLVVRGDPSSVFVELSKRYDLIVIGNRGKGGLAERLLGTTSSSLPAYAYCPIVVVPYTDDEGHILHLDNHITKIAVGADESEWGIEALRIAARLAYQWKASLEVILAVSEFQEDDREAQESLFEDLQERISPLREQYPGLAIHERLVNGSAVDVLCEASRDHDVVVVGSRGRAGFTGLMFGSTSQGLLQHSEHPVVVVPRKFVEANRLREASTIAEQEHQVNVQREVSTADGRYASAVSDEDEQVLMQQLEVDSAEQSLRDELERQIDPDAPHRNRE